MRPAVELHCVQCGSLAATLDGDCVAALLKKTPFSLMPVTYLSVQAAQKGWLLCATCSNNKNEQDDKK